MNIALTHSQTHWRSIDRWNQVPHTGIQPSSASHAPRSTPCRRNVTLRAILPFLDGSIVLLMAYLRVVIITLTKQAKAGVHELDRETP